MLVDLRGTGYYIPFAYADSTEIIALCKVVAEYDGVFVVHQRSEAVSPGFACAAGGHPALHSRKAYRGRVR